MTEQMKNLFKGPVSESGPVECLGQTFTNERERREHFLKLLAEKLKDPVFRKLDGFPIGSDQDILALSDPPYFTACPNPFLNDFVERYGQPYDCSVAYSKEPFAIDVLEGKNDPIYNAHSYHTKVPHRAVMRYILHYTQPGDLVFDAFCGTGMTGVAAQLCGSRTEVESLGYRVDVDGNIFQPEENSGKTDWTPFSKIGSRFPLLNDLSPVAGFIAHNFNTSVNPRDFEIRARNILRAVDESHGWMYQTLHAATPQQISSAVQLIEREKKPELKTLGQTGRINFLIWTDVFICQDCAQEIVFWDAAVDREAGTVLEEFRCTSCGAMLSKRSLDRAWNSSFDEALGITHQQTKQVPVAINYSIGSKRFEKSIDDADRPFSVRRSYSAPANGFQRVKS